MPVGAGYLFQTAGLTTTGAADAGLLTGLYVILTPILDRVVYRAPLARVTIASALLGLLGTGLLTLHTSHGVGLGDILEVLTAVAFAIQIVWLGRYSSGQPSMPIALGQVAPVAMVCVCLTAITEGSGFRWPDAKVWLAIFITGGLASALAFWVQTFVQQRIRPARTAIILLGEPAFATAFAVWLGGERLNDLQWLGAGLILVSLLAHEAWMATRGGMVAQGVLG
jgi:drug/metabolite transporter (DMT)-like permease